MTKKIQKEDEKTKKENKIVKIEDIVDPDGNVEKKITFEDGSVEIILADEFKQK